MSDLYFCPIVGEIESGEHGGFKGGTCCAHPDKHVYLGYSTPGIEAISQYLSDKTREEYRGAGPDLSDWNSPEDAVYDTPPGHMWAQTIHTEDDGLLHLPVYAPDGSEIEGLVCTREDAVTLQTMLTGYLGDCDSTCDDDCDVVCHETHAIPRKRHHPVGEHATDLTALEYATTALARHDLMNLVGMAPHEELPDREHPFWTMWRGNARTTITAYNGYIEHSGHRYLSTGCRHGEHGYCQSNTGSQGDKTPAQCKFCGSGCVCSCHMPGTVTVVERIVNPAALEAVAAGPSMKDLCTGTDEAMCGAEPPLRADHPGTQWGDCWCTLLPDHEGDHRCEPCAHRHGAPSWPQEASDDENARMHKEHTQTQTAIALCDHDAEHHGPESGCIECRCSLTTGHKEKDQP